MSLSSRFKKLFDEAVEEEEYLEVLLVDKKLYLSHSKKFFDDNELPYKSDENGYFIYPEAQFEKSDLNYKSLILKFEDEKILKVSYKENRFFHKFIPKTECYHNIPH